MEGGIEAFKTRTEVARSRVESFVAPGSRPSVAMDQDFRKAALSHADISHGLGGRSESTQSLDLESEHNSESSDGGLSSDGEIELERRMTEASESGRSGEAEAQGVGRGAEQNRPTQSLSFAAAMGSHRQLGSSSNVLRGGRGSFRGRGRGRGRASHRNTSSGHGAQQGNSLGDLPEDEHDQYSSHTRDTQATDWTASGQSDYSRTSSHYNDETSRETREDSGASVGWGHTYDHHDSSAGFDHGRFNSTGSFAMGQEGQQVRSGTLLKRGHRRKNWLERHFHLEDGILTYWSAAPSHGGKKKGQVCLLGTTLTIEPRPDKNVEAIKQGALTPNIFKLTVADGTDERQTLLLCAESEANMFDWVAAIGAAWVDPDGTTGLMRAAQAGSIDELDHMARVGVDINLQNNDGWTALMYAAREGHLDCITELMRHGADVNMQSLTGNTALMDAVRDAHYEVMSFLIQQGADLQIANDNGHTLAMVAVQGGDPHALQILVEAGADLESPDQKGLTPLMNAAECVLEGGFECLQILIEQNVNLDATQPSTGNDSLMMAAQIGSLDTVEMLVSSGANVHQLNHLMKSALELAQMAGNEDVVEFLAQGLPTFTLAPVDTMFDEGTTVKLVTRAAGLPAPHFEWRRDAELLSPENNQGLRIEVQTRTLGAVGTRTGDKRRSIRSSLRPGDMSVQREIEVECVLLIYDATREATEGNYSVRAKNDIGIARTNQVVVRASDPPVVSEPPRSFRVDPGNRAEIKFSCEAEPAPNFQWFRLDALVPQQGETEWECRERLGETLTDYLRQGEPIPAPVGTAASLIFDPVKVSDDARYFCKVTNSAGSCTTLDGGCAPASLHVNRPPSEMVAPALNLEAVQLSVDIGGTPEPALQWLCNGKPIKGETKAQIEIDPTLRAEYSVVATNSAGATTIQVAKFPSDRVLDMLSEHTPSM